ncbi:MAG: four helix bundle protein [Acidobacteriota bacterium]
MFTKRIGGECDCNLKRGDGNTSRIKTWKLVDELTLKVFEAAKSLPHEERDCLSRQLRETAVLCGASASEWAGRKKDCDDFLTLKRLHTLMIYLRYYIYLARRLNLIEQKQYSSLIQKHEAASNIIEGIMERSEDKIIKKGEDGAILS